MENEIVKLETPELEAIEPSKAKQIKQTFEPMAEMLAEFEKAYNELMAIPLDEMTPELTQRYKRLRLDIGKVRIETGKLKDKQKEYIKLEDKAIMGIHNILVWAVTEKEDKLKEREDYFEIQERKRLEELQRTRAEKLSKYVEDAHERNLSDMDEDVWEAYFQTKKKEHEDRIAAEKKAEAERKEQERKEQLRKERTEIIMPYYDFFPDVDLTEIDKEEFDKHLNEAKAKKDAHLKEQERIRKENERLEKEREAERKKAEAEKAVHEKRTKELQPYIIFIRNYNKMINLPEKDYQQELAEIKKGAEQHWQHEKEKAEKILKEKAEYEEKLRKEREERERYQKELEAKAEAERKAKAEAEAQKEAELKKDDQAKVTDLKNDLIALKSKYTFKSKKNKDMYTGVGQLIDKVVNYIDQK